MQSSGYKSSQATSLAPTTHSTPQKQILQMLMEGKDPQQQQQQQSASSRRFPTRNPMGSEACDYNYYPQDRYGISNLPSNSTGAVAHSQRTHGHVRDAASNSYATVPPVHPSALSPTALDYIESGMDKSLSSGFNHRGNSSAYKLCSESDTLLGMNTDKLMPDRSGVILLNSQQQNCVRALADLLVCRHTTLPLFVGWFSPIATGLGTACMQKTIEEVLDLCAVDGDSPLEATPLLFIAPPVLCLVLGYTLGLLISWQVGLVIGLLLLTVFTFGIGICLYGTRRTRPWYKVNYLAQWASRQVQNLGLLLNILFTHPPQRNASQMSVRYICVHQNLSLSTSAESALLTSMERLWSVVVDTYPKFLSAILHMNLSNHVSSHQHFKRVCLFPKFLLAVYVILAIAILGTMLRVHESAETSLFSRKSFLSVFIILCLTLCFIFLLCLPRLIRSVKALIHSPLRDLRNAIRCLATMGDVDAEGSFTNQLFSLQSGPQMEGNKSDRLYGMEIPTSGRTPQQDTLNKGLTKVEKLALKYFCVLCRYLQAYDSYVGEYETRLLLCIDATDIYSVNGANQNSSFTNSNWLREFLTALNRLILTYRDTIPYYPPNYGTPTTTMATNLLPHASSTLSLNANPLSAAASSLTGANIVILVTAEWEQFLFLSNSQTPAPNYNLPNVSMERPFTTFSQKVRMNSLSNLSNSIPADKHAQDVCDVHHWVQNVFHLPLYIHDAKEKLAWTHRLGNLKFQRQPALHKDLLSTKKSPGQLNSESRSQANNKTGGRPNGLLQHQMSDTSGGTEGGVGGMAYPGQTKQCPSADSIPGSPDIGLNSVNTVGQGNAGYYRETQSYPSDSILSPHSSLMSPNNHPGKSGGFSTYDPLAFTAWHQGGEDGRVLGTADHPSNMGRLAPPTTLGSSSDTRSVVELFIGHKNELSDLNIRVRKHLIVTAAFTVRLLRLQRIEFPLNSLIRWICICHHWPYHVSWMLLFLEEHWTQLLEQHLNDVTSVTLMQLFEGAMRRLRNEFKTLSSGLNPKSRQQGDDESGFVSTSFTSTRSNTANLIMVALQQLSLCDQDPVRLEKFLRNETRMVQAYQFRPASSTTALSPNAKVLTLDWVKAFAQSSVYLCPYLGKCIRDVLRMKTLFTPKVVRNRLAANSEYHFQPIVFSSGDEQEAAVGSLPLATTAVNGIRRARSLPRNQQGPLHGTQNTLDGNVSNMEKSMGIMNELLPMNLNTPHRLFHSSTQMEQDEANRKHRHSISQQQLLAKTPSATSVASTLSRLKCPVMLKDGFQPNSELTNLTVEEVKEILPNIAGFSPSEALLHGYQQRLEELNISGLVLSVCDLEQLRPELRMTFGDWQLFRTLILYLRSKEMLMQAQKDEETAYKMDEDDVRENSSYGVQQKDSLLQSPNTDMNELRIIPGELDKTSYAGEGNRDAKFSRKEQIWLRNEQSASVQGSFETSLNSNYQSTQTKIVEVEKKPVEKPTPQDLRSIITSPTEVSGTGESYQHYFQPLKETSLDAPEDSPSHLSLSPHDLSMGLTRPSINLKFPTKTRLSKPSGQPYVNETEVLEVNKNSNTAPVGEALRSSRSYTQLTTNSKGGSLDVPDPWETQGDVKDNVTQLSTKSGNKTETETDISERPRSHKHHKPRHHHRHRHHHHHHHHRQDTMEDTSNTSSHAKAYGKALPTSVSGRHCVPALLVRLDSIPSQWKTLSGQEKLIATDFSQEDELKPLETGPSEDNDDEEECTCDYWNELEHLVLVTRSQLRSSSSHSTKHRSGAKSEPGSRSASRNVVNDPEIAIPPPSSSEIPVPSANQPSWRQNSEIGSKHSHYMGNTANYQGEFQA